MNSKLFGSLVAGAVTGMLMTGVALADGGKKKQADAKKDDKAETGWCKSNSCAGHVKAGDKATSNSCAGQMACKGVTKAECEKDGVGTWTTEAKPGK